MPKRAIESGENRATKKKKFETIWSQFDQLRRMIQEAEESEAEIESNSGDDSGEGEQADNESVMAENSPDVDEGSQNPIDNIEGNEATPTLPAQKLSLSNILGELPKAQLCAENDLHEELTVRWTNYIQAGLTKEKRDEIQEKYPFFKNCPTLKAPELNPELFTCMDTKAQRTDKFMSALQDQIGYGLVALGQQMSHMLDLDGSESTLPALADSAQLFCNVHHAISTHRKFNLFPFLNYDCRKLAESSKSDEFLLGQKFFEEVKNKEALKKAGREMKAPPPPSLKPQSAYSKTQGGRQQPTTSRTPNNNLNWRRYPQKSRMKSSSGINARTLDKPRAEERFPKTRK